MSWATAAAIGVPLVANYLAGREQSEAQKDANRINQQNAERNIALQREFATNGIRWKVEDAKKAGLHPLAALGASTQSFSPVSVGASPADGGAQSLSHMGQDISRAIQTTRTAEEQQLAKLQLATAQADLDGKIIDNQIRGSQLQKLNSVPTALPSGMDNSNLPGQGNAVRVKPSEIIASDRNNTAVQDGVINTLQYTRETSGNLGIAPSSDIKERNEDDFIAESLWHLKNRVLPPAPSTDKYPIPENLRKQGYKYWFWNPWKQEFVPSKNP